MTLHFFRRFVSLVFATGLLQWILQKTKVVPGKVDYFFSL